MPTYNLLPIHRERRQSGEQWGMSYYSQAALRFEARKLPGGDFVAVSEAGEHILLT